MKKTRAYFFVLLLIVSVHPSCDPRTVPATHESTVQHANTQPLRPEGLDSLDSVLENKEVKLGYDLQKKDRYGRTLTYDLLEERPFNNSEVMKSDFAPVLILPPDMDYQESFVSLKKDAREQQIGPWRGWVNAGRKKFLYNFSVEDTTGFGSVRVSKPKLSVEYMVSENAAIGVEASREIHDSVDAEAWGKSANEEKAAQLKYKLLF